MPAPLLYVIAAFFSIIVLMVSHGPDESVTNSTIVLILSAFGVAGIFHAILIASG
jgi:hypothetical protein